MHLKVICRDEVLEALRYLGFKIALVKTESEALKEFLEELGRESIIVIEEELFDKIKDKLRIYLAEVKYPPYIVIIPNSKRPTTHRLKDLYELMSKAVGVKLKWSK